MYANIDAFKVYDFETIIYHTVNFCENLTNVNRIDVQSIVFLLESSMNLSKNHMGDILMFKKNAFFSRWREFIYLCSNYAKMKDTWDAWRNVKDAQSISLSKRRKKSSISSKALRFRRWLY